MYKIDTQFKELIIIGNGLDLNLGLKTSYGDFIQSETFLAVRPKMPKKMTRSIKRTCNKSVFKKMEGQQN